MSLATAPATTILPTSRPEAARVFYGDVLGLPFRGLDADGELLFALAAGATLALIEKPAGSQADHTAISFGVTDIGASIADLQTRGVVFDDYDLPGLKTVEHVCVLGTEKAAWFKDPDGNILCPTNPSRPDGPRLLSNDHAGPWRLPPPGRPSASVPMPCPQTQRTSGRGCRGPLRVPVRRQRPR